MGTSCELFMDDSELFRRTRWVCDNNLDKLSEEDVTSYLEYLGWPKVPSEQLVRSSLPRKLPLWILNRLLPQLKKWYSLKASIKLQKNNYSGSIDLDNLDGSIGSPTLFRVCDVSLVAYLIPHVRFSGLLAAHSFILSKMMKLECVGSRKNTSSVINDREIAPLREILGNGKDGALLLEKYIIGIWSVRDLSYAIFNGFEGKRDISRLNDRLITSINRNEMVKIILDDVALFTIWNDAYLKFECDGLSKNIVGIVSSILVGLLEHFVIVSNIMLILLEIGTNIKSSYICLVQDLMNQLLCFRSSIDDMQTRTGIFSSYNSTFLDRLCVNKVNNTIASAIDCIYKLIFFPLNPEYIRGFCDFVASKYFEVLLDAPEFDEANPENSAINYCHKYFTRLVIILNEVQKNSEFLAPARGVCLLLPEIFQEILSSIALYVDCGDDHHPLAFYGASCISIVIPMIIKLCKGLMKTPFCYYNNLQLGNTIFDAVFSFCRLLSISKDNNIFLYTGRRSNFISETVKVSIDFAFFVLKSGYVMYSDAVPNAKDYANFAKGENNFITAKQFIVRFPFSNSANFAKFHLRYISDLLWESLFILTSLNLEYVDSNIDIILDLLKRDYMLNFDSDLDSETLNSLMSVDGAASDEHITPSQTFVENLIYVYSSVNDLSSLINNIGNYLHTLDAKESKCLFLQQPRAIRALRLSSAESSSFQIPLVLKSFCRWCRDPITSEFMFNLLTFYLSGLEFSSKIIEGVILPLETLLKSMKLDYNRQGMLLSLQSLIAMRKLISWMSIGCYPERFYGYFSMIYEYSLGLSRYVGTKCDISTFKTIFWLCYHFSMVINDEIFSECLNWTVGISEIMHRLMKAISINTTDLEFVKASSMLIISNADAFKTALQSENFIDEVLEIVLTLEFDESMIYWLDCLVICFANYFRGKNTFSNKLLDKIVSIIAETNVSLNLRMVSLSTARRLLECCTYLYTAESNLVDIFYKLAEICICSLVAPHEMGEDFYFLQLIENILGVLSYIIEYENRLDCFKCTFAITLDYIKYVQPSSNLICKMPFPNSSDRINFFVLLQKIKSNLVPAYKNGLFKDRHILELLSSFYSSIILKIKNEKYIETFFDNFLNHDYLSKGFITSNLSIETMILTACQFEGLQDLCYSGIMPIGLKFYQKLTTAIILKMVMKTLHDKGLEYNDHQLFVQPEDLGLLTAAVLDSLSQSVDICNVETDFGSNLMYFSVLMYILSLQINATSGNLATLNQISIIGKSVHRIASSCDHEILETVCECILGYLFKLVSSSENVLTLADKCHHITESLLSVICVQTKVYWGKRAHFSNSENKIEILKALCGCETDEISGVIRILLERGNQMDILHDIFSQIGSLCYSFSNCDSKNDSEDYWCCRLGCMELISLLTTEVVHSNSPSCLDQFLFSKNAAINSLCIIINVHLKDMRRSCNTMNKNCPPGVSTRLLLNYTINVTVSLKLFNLTKHHASKRHNRRLSLFLGNHLLFLSQVGTKIMEKLNEIGAGRDIFEKVATNVYFCLYNRIKIAEGTSDRQIARQLNDWIQRAHIVVSLVAQFVKLIRHDNPSMYALVERLMVIICNKKLLTATKWYIPHILVSIIQVWYDINKASNIDQNKNPSKVRSNKILKTCVLGSIANCDPKTKQTLLLLLPSSLRLFVKENKTAIKHK